MKIILVCYPKEDDASAVEDSLKKGALLYGEEPFILQTPSPQEAKGFLKNKSAEVDAVFGTTMLFEVLTNHGLSYVELGQDIKFIFHADKEADFERMNASCNGMKNVFLVSSKESVCGKWLIDKMYEILLLP